MLPETKSRQYNTSTSLGLASYRDPFLRKVLKLKKLSSTCTRRVRRACKYKDIQQVLNWQMCRLAIRSVSFLNLVVFCEEGSEHRKLKSLADGSTSHSAVEVRRNLQRPVLRSSLIPERMELGIFAEVRFSGEVTPREVVRLRSKVEVSLNSKKCSPR
jgi:hypothetical protein